MNYDSEVKPYQYPRFTKNKIKNAFLKDGTWDIIDDSPDHIEFMKKGYHAPEGFWACFVSEDDENCGKPFPVGEADLISMSSWVAVDYTDASDYDNVEQMVAQANACVEAYGKKYKDKGN